MRSATRWLPEIRVTGEPLMVNVGKREDDLLDSISELAKSRDRARRLIEEFVLADSSLWPILSEIDLVLAATVKK